LLGYKGESIYILLNTKGKIITGYSIRFAKERQLVYDLSSNNNSKNKLLLKYNRQSLFLAKNIRTRKPNINIDLNTLDLSSVFLLLSIEDSPENKISQLPYLDNPSNKLFHTNRLYQII
jgi:hypothetical protein